MSTVRGSPSSRYCPASGRGGKRPERAALARESEVLAADEPLVAALDGAGVEASRRALRLRPAGLAWEFDDDSLVLEFELPAGAYATSVLRELVTLLPEPISAG